MRRSRIGRCPPSTERWCCSKARPWCWRRSRGCSPTELFVLARVWPVSSAARGVIDADTGSVAVLALSATAFAAAFSLAWVYRRVERHAGIRSRGLARRPEGAASFVVLLALIALFSSGTRRTALAQIFGSPSAEGGVGWTAAAIAVAVVLTVVRLRVVAPAVLGRLTRIARWSTPIEQIRSHIVELSGVSAPLVALALLEEFVCRGLLVVLWRATGQSPVVCLIVSTAIFAALHAGQGMRGVKFALFAGLGFGGLTLWTGAATAAMLAHVFYNTGVGAAAVWARVQIRHSSRTVSTTASSPNRVELTARHHSDAQVPSASLVQSDSTGALKNCAREH